MPAPSQFYSRRHWAQFTPTRDTAADVADRAARRLACARTVADVSARFPVITPENAAAVAAYQAERIAFHLAQCRSV